MFHLYGNNKIKSNQNSLSTNTTKFSSKLLQSFLILFVLIAIGISNDTDALTSVKSLQHIGNKVAYSNTGVSRKIHFNASLAVVNSADFSLAQTGGANEATITSVTAIAKIWTIMAKLGHFYFSTSLL